MIINNVIIHNVLFISLKSRFGFSFHSYRDGHAHTHQSEETRVWHKRDNKWQNVHYHRSTTGHISGSTPFEYNAHRK